MEGGRLLPGSPEHSFSLRRGADSKNAARRNGWQIQVGYSREAICYFAFSFLLRMQRITVQAARATIAALTTQVPMIRPILQGLVL